MAYRLTSTDIVVRTVDIFKFPRQGDAIRTPAAKQQAQQLLSWFQSIGLYLDEQEKAA